jgi:hypothetical protein
MVNPNIPLLPFNLETQLELDIVTDPEWQAGLKWGHPRPGHPEGQVLFHIRDVLHNIDWFLRDSNHRPNLRLIALIHDTFKYKTFQSRLSPDEQSHGYFARKFAERYISDCGILDVIELHDEAYKASLLLTRCGNRQAAEKQARALITRLKSHITLFMQFYYCDNRTGDKSIIHYEWFEELVEEQFKSES